MSVSFESRMFTGSTARPTRSGRLALIITSRMRGARTARPNMRLKLKALLLKGSVIFPRVRDVRRSLSAIRWTAAGIRFQQTSKSKPPTPQFEGWTRALIPVLYWMLECKQCGRRRVVHDSYLEFVGTSSTLPGVGYAWTPLTERYQCLNGCSRGMRAV